MASAQSIRCRAAVNNEIIRPQQIDEKLAKQGLTVLGCTPERLAELRRTACSASAIRACLLLATHESGPGTEPEYQRVHFGGGNRGLSRRKTNVLTNDPADHSSHLGRQPHQPVRVPVRDFCSVARRHW